MVTNPTKPGKDTCRGPWRHSEPVQKVGTPGNERLEPGRPVGLRSTTTTGPPLFLSSRSDETDPVHPVQRTGSDRTRPNRPAHVVCLPDPPKLPRRARPPPRNGRRAVVCDCAAQVADGDSIFVIAKAGFGFAVVDDHATQIIRFAVLLPLAWIGIVLGESALRSS